MAAWLLVQVADLVLVSFAAPVWTMRALLIALGIGFPVALVIAWAFELTSRGVVPEAQVDRTIKIRDRSGQRVDEVLLLIVAVVIVFMGLERFVFSQRSAPAPGTADPATTASPATADPPRAADSPGLTPASVAVLPFAVLSREPDDEYFGDGLTEEVINALSQLPDLMVTARTSAFHFKARNLPVSDIASRLGVTHVVEGSVRRAGEQFRVTAQLVRADDGIQLWSDSYDRDTRDTLAVQGDIAENVATALDILTDDPVRQRMQRLGTRSTDALIAFQKGMEYHERAHRELNRVSLLRRANEHFERAIELAPGLVEAHAYHTDLFSHVLISQAAGVLDASITARDIERAPARLASDYDKSIRFARTPQQRHDAEFGRALALGDWRGLAVLGEKAAAQRGCEAPLWLHLVTPLVADATATLDAFLRVTACDPLRVQPHVHIIGSLLWLGAADRALASAQDGLELIDHPSLIRHLALALGFAGQPDTAQNAATDGIRDEDELLLVQSMLAAIRGDAAAALEYEGRYQARYGPNDRETLVLAAVRGDRAGANRLAGAIDARPFGHMALLQAVYGCFCGMPFDLAATPVLASLLAVSGLEWPPDRPFDLPLKHW